MPARCQNTTGWLVDSRMKAMSRARTTAKSDIRMEMCRSFWGYVMKWPAQNREGMACWGDDDCAELHSINRAMQAKDRDLKDLWNIPSTANDNCPVLVWGGSIQWFSTKVVREQNSGGDWGWRGKQGLDQGCRVWSKSKLWR